MALEELLARLGQMLHPLVGCAADRRAEILTSAKITRVGSGKPVFQEGERDGDCVYLIKGSIDTFSGGQRLKRLEAGTPAACWPLPDDQPRKVTARAATDVGLLKLPRALLRPLLEDEGDGGGVEVREIQEASETGDWMTMLLRSPLYAQLPASNIQRIMATMESVIVSPGDVIVRQGEIGDYFYFLSRGKARVFRQARDGEPPVLLAELKEGVSFGEEALVAGIPRNATVAMTTEGRVMRLPKDHFESLILEPTLQRLDWVDAEHLVHEGGAWIDVRFPDEHEKDGLDHSLNIPLGMLRMRMPKLDRDQRYVVYCDTGQRSAAGAFLMAGAGFDVYVLDGGITTPEGIETMDEGGATINLSQFLEEEEQMPALSVDFEPEDVQEKPEERTQPDNTVEMARQLRNTIEQLRQENGELGRRIGVADQELQATREALATERERGRELVRELQHLRQTLTDMQRQAHAALERERSVYEKELSQAVGNLEQALSEKEVQLEVLRVRNAEEIARLRRLLEGTPPAKSAS